jgi:hypothetical protein
MAKAKTAPFYITEQLVLDNTTALQTVKLDLGAYVDPADKQGVLITNVDFIWNDYDTHMPPVMLANDQFRVEVLDTAIGALVGANNYHLVASANLTTDAQSNPSRITDMWPDRLGISNQGRIVVNDELEINGQCSQAMVDFACTVRLTVQVVTLTQKDFMSLALQTVSN